MTIDSKPPKQLAASTIASRAFEKIQRLEAERDQEIAAAPEQLRNEYQERIDRVVASVESPAARELLAKLRA